MTLTEYVYLNHKEAPKEIHYRIANDAKIPDSTK